MKNIAYAGALAALLDMDTDLIRALLKEKYSAKQALMDSNQKAVDLGYDYAKKNFSCPLPIHLAKMDATKDSILIDGNTSAALGCLYAGATVGAWYPITPATSLMEAFSSFCKKYRRDQETKKNLACIIQAEDELAAIGMVIGASWAGARAFTPTAGPGISLMNEFIGLAYYAEVPAVIFDIQRAGPSTGLPTRTGQQDILSTAVLSHGDTNHPLLLPASVTECYTMAMEAFDLAEQLQQPIFVMSDLDLGMNTWMAHPFEYPTAPFNRGKRLDADTLKQIGQFGRYRDVDGDGIAYRTVPGDGLPSYFTRGSGHNEQALYSERADDYVKNLDRLSRKFQTAKTMMPRPEIDMAAEGGIGIIAYGTTHWAIVESRDQLKAERGLETSYLRLRAYPFGEELNDFIDRHDRVYVVEQNRDAQMLSLLRIDLAPPRVLKLRSIRHYAGLPIDGRSVTTELLVQEGEPDLGPKASSFGTVGAD
jgi:2-oxoglutarate/2-oxoacid ferredoxin oxidoreductase subunit alpha